MISLRIEVSVDEDIVDEWCAERGYNDNDFEDYLVDFVEDHYELFPDSVEML